LKLKPRTFCPGGSPREQRHVPPAARPATGRTRRREAALRPSPAAVQFGEPVLKRSPEGECGERSAGNPREELHGVEAADCRLGTMSAMTSAVALQVGIQLGQRDGVLHGGPALAEEVDGRW